MARHSSSITEVVTGPPGAGLGCRASALPVAEEAKACGKQEEDENNEAAAAALAGRAAVASAAGDLAPAVGRGRKNFLPSPLASVFVPLPAAMRYTRAGRG